MNEIYTGTLLGIREPKLSGWLGFHESEEGGSGGGSRSRKLGGWLQVRFPGDVEWRRVWVDVVPGSKGGHQHQQQSTATTKKNKRSSLSFFGKKKEVVVEAVDSVVIDGLPGGRVLSTIAFYEKKPETRADQPLCIAQHG